MNLTVYVDSLFVLNFFVNFLILFTTGKIIKNKPKKRWLFFGSLISALYSVLIFFPRLKLMSEFLMKLLFSIILLLLVFAYKNLLDFFKTLVIFYFVSFFFAGVLFYISLATRPFGIFNYMLNNGVSYLDITLKSMVLSFSISYAIIILFTKFCRTIYLKDKIKLEIEIDLNGKKMKMMALLDTGNSLVEPISHFPVIVAEFESIKQILPNKVSDIYQKKFTNNFEDPIEISKFINNCKNLINFKSIPFSSLGKNGVIIGFEPTGFKVLDRKLKFNKNIVIGIKNENFSKYCGCTAIMNADIIYA